jgi:hypothetical protein
MYIKRTLVNVANPTHQNCKKLLLTEIRYTKGWIDAGTLMIIRMAQRDRIRKPRPVSTNCH